MRRPHQHTTALLITVITLLMAAALPARTFDLPPGKWWEIPRLVNHIQLTTQQQENIGDLVYRHAQRMIDLNAGVERTKLALERQVDENVIDPESVRQAFANFQQARQILEKERFEMLLAVRQVLSPEQWRRLAELRERLDQGRQRRPGAYAGPQNRRPPDATPGQGGFPRRPN